MEDTRGTAALPGAYEWTLRDPRRDEARHYMQTELSLDGEAALIALAPKLGAILKDAGYTWADIYQLTDEKADIQWDEVARLVAHIARFAPALIAEATAVLLGIFPTDEDGQPNPTYETELAHIRRAMNVARFVEMVRIFMAQNDYARMLAPFSPTLANVMGGLASGSEQSPDDSSTQQVVSADGSTLELEPSPPTRTGEAQPSEPEDSSEPSTT